jgi:hypothetical protein
MDSRAASASMTVPSSGVGQYVMELASLLGVRYVQTYSDQWAESVTRLVGDEVASTDVKDLLVALKRAGKISSREMASLLVSYLREEKQARIEQSVRIAGK